MSAVSGFTERRPTNDLAHEEVARNADLQPVRPAGLHSAQSPTGEGSAEPSSADRMSAGHTGQWPVFRPADKHGKLHRNCLNRRDFVEPPESEAARKRLLSGRGEPLFYANWDNVIFIHYETDPLELRRCVPYDLDLYHGHALVSFVAFTMRGMRLRFGGRIGELLLRPIATHDFLNVRTYVRHNGEPGIYFMREWLNSRIATWLGPWSFGLPYRFGQIDYVSASLRERRGQLVAKEGSLNFRATLQGGEFESCPPKSLDEFLLERYTAFTQHRRTQRFFRIWHAPWQQSRINVDIVDDDLIDASGNCWQNAQMIGGNYSPGVGVWMGWPHPIGKGPL